MLLLLQTRASCLVLMVSSMQLSNWALFECVQLGEVCNLQHGILGEQACVLWLFYTTARSMLLWFFLSSNPTLSCVGSQQFRTWFLCDRRQIQTSFTPASHLLHANSQRIIQECFKEFLNQILFVVRLVRFYCRFKSGSHQIHSRTVFSNFKDTLN